MDFSNFAFLTVLISVLFFAIQRTETKKRRIAILVMILPLMLIQRYAYFRDVHTETQLAFGVAALLNLFFWLFIGRYNPVSSSDKIKVLDMND